MKAKKDISADQPKLFVDCSWRYLPVEDFAERMVSGETTRTWVIADTKWRRLLIPNIIIGQSVDCNLI